MIVHVTVQESDANKALENAGGSDLMNRLKGENAGLPFFAFVDANGKMIENSKRKKDDKDPGSNVGHPVQPEEIAWFMTMLGKGAPKMLEKERAQIENWLKNQKT